MEAYNGTKEPNFEAGGPSAQSRENASRARRSAREGPARRGRSGVTLGPALCETGLPFPSPVAAAPSTEAKADHPRNDSISSFHRRCSTNSTYSHPARRCTREGRSCQGSKAGGRRSAQFCRQRGPSQQATQQAKLSLMCRANEGTLAFFNRDRGGNIIRRVRDVND